MQYMFDAVVLVRHFMGRGEIGTKASRIPNGIEKSDDQLLISVISLMEVVYLVGHFRVAKSNFHSF